MEQAILSRWQFFLLTFNVTFGTAFFIRPGGLIAIGKQDAWVLPLIGGVAGLLMALLWLGLASLYPQKNIIEICRESAGKAGIFFALLYIWYFIEIASWVTRNLGDFMQVVLMPKTPKSVFHMMFLLVAAYAVIKGINAISRLSEFLSPIMYSVFLFVGVVLIRDWDTDKVKPILDTEIWQSFWNSNSIIGFPFVEPILLLMLFSYAPNKGGKRIFLLGIGLTALALSLVVFITVGTIGITRASHLIYPIFTMIQEVQLASFIEHMEATIIIIWLFSIFIKLAIALYCATIAICHLSGIPNRTGIVIPLSILVAGLALTIHTNVIETMDWDKNYSFWYHIVFGIYIPAFLLLITFVKRRFKKNNGLPHGKLGGGIRNEK
ncbi:GerAB/ArcD/ProY family transporter [Fictibacillus fluitans]|uniref:Endospore germination permease n=1 Tax=Fictibacillus fluitans TaxID=3058422 RepID=A0ABT8HTG7_9BACL|nr:endospore germination permease [Fictibacillus sp. NE201]MDN4524051.1 endospore germination permease [Fictibacillus sp. NE201]